MKTEIKKQIEEIQKALLLEESSTPRDLGIRVAAANECLRAQIDAESEYKNILHSFGHIPQANDWDMASKMLGKLGDLLSRTSDSEMKMVSEAQSIVGNGSLIEEIRKYACQKVDMFGEYLQEPEAPSVDVITFKAKVINQKIK